VFRLRAGYVLAAAGVVFAAMAGSPTVAVAQPGGPYTPLILSLPSGARPLAMGNVGVASRDDDVLFYNPAQLAVARGTSGSAERYSSTSAGGTLSSVTRLSNSAFAIGAQVVDYRSPTSAFCDSGGFGGCLSQAEFPLDRETSVGPGVAQGLSTEAILGYATTFKSIRVGAAAKYASDELAAVRIQRGSVDVGVAKDLFRFFTLALAVQNIGPSTSLACSEHSEIGHDDCEVQSTPAPANNGIIVPVYLPLRTTLGGSFSHQLGEFDLVSTAAVSVLRANGVSPAGGAELGYSWLDGYDIALRGGLRRPLPGEAPITAGAGLTMDRLSIDYALETLTGSRVVHRLGFRIR
ncbi:MAG TPA: hypothetical protein VHV78_16465, partial [Gemmatimonadaceae bacterium]|nr:hypothetical protein [Gemmatimonadaceae bacterium]